MTIELEDLNELLEQLGDPAHTFSPSRLFFLSDLSGPALTTFRSAWATYPDAARRRLAAELVQLAEANFEVIYDRLFVDFLSDPDEEVRATAIDGLWENESVSLVGPLLSTMRNDPSFRVRASAALALGRYVLAGELEKIDETIANRILTELLVAIRNPHESLEVRRRAMEAAAYSCTPELDELLQNAYYDEDEPMRISAVVGMGRSCDERWAHFVTEELDSDSTAMRYEAAWACGEMGLRSAVPKLAMLVNDPDREVCNAAIWALGQIGGTAARQVLTDAYVDADEDMQIALDEALAEQALLNGDLNISLYDLEEDLDLDLDLDDDEEMLTLWSARKENGELDDLDDFDELDL